MYRFGTCSQRMVKRDEVFYYHKREQWSLNKGHLRYSYHIVSLTYMLTSDSLRPL